MQLLVQFSLIGARRVALAAAMGVCCFSCAESPATTSRGSAASVDQVSIMDSDMAPFVVVVHFEDPVTEVCILICRAPRDRVRLQAAQSSGPSWQVEYDGVDAGYEHLAFVFNVRRGLRNVPTASVNGANLAIGPGLVFIQETSGRFSLLNARVGTEDLESLILSDGERRSPTRMALEEEILTKWCELGFWGVSWRQVWTSLASYRSAVGGV